MNLGLPKSGTTTLARALRRGGWSVADHKLRRRAPPVVRKHGQLRRAAVYDGYFDTGDPFARLDGRWTR